MAEKKPERMINTMIAIVRGTMIVVDYPPIDEKFFSKEFYSFK